MANNLTATNGTLASFRILNPSSALGKLEPEIASQVMISTCVTVGVAAIFIWDVLNNIVGDIRLLTRYKISLPTLTYFMSRLSSLACTIACVLFETAPVNICFRLQMVIAAEFALTISLTSLLFYWRVRAIFNSNPYIVGFFTFMWVATVGGTMTSLGADGANIADTKFCIKSSLRSYSLAAVVGPLVNDTLVFCAISWRLLSNACIDYNFKSGLKVLTYGRYLPAFSRALLQDGQVYYLTTLAASLLTVIVFYLPGSPTYRVMLLHPNVMLMNIMACRVYRNTKFGIYREETISTIMMLGTNGEQRAQNGVMPLTFSKPLHDEQRRNLSFKFTDVEGQECVGSQNYRIHTKSDLEGSPTALAHPEDSRESERITID